MQDVWQEVNGNNTVYGGFGALVFEVCAHVNVVSRQPTFCWEITCVKSLWSQWIDANWPHTKAQAH